MTIITKINVLKLVLVMISLWFISNFLYEHTLTRLDGMRAEQQALPEIVTMAERNRQLTCLAKNIYYEAGSESFEGKVAVAQVTINRTDHSGFPGDICGVVYQKNIVYNKVLCQFSWYCMNPSVIKPIRDTVYTESMEVAKKVLLEGFRLPGLVNALYYHADYINPGWKRPKIMQIGHHIFYMQS